MSSIVTPDTVTQAVRSIVARGEKPSIRRIREEIGGGSMSSIHALYRDLQAKEHEEGTNPDNLLNSPHIAALEALSPDVANQVRIAFRKQAAAELAAIQIAASEAEARSEELQHIANDLEQDLEAANKAILDRDRRLEELGGLVDAIHGLPTTLAEIHRDQLRQMTDAAAAVVPAVRDGLAELSSELATAVEGLYAHANEQARIATVRASAMGELQHAFFDHISEQARLSIERERVIEERHVAGMKAVISVITTDAAERDLRNQAKIAEIHASNQSLHREIANIRRSLQQPQRPSRIGRGSI